MHEVSHSRTNSTVSLNELKLITELERERVERLERTPVDASYYEYDDSEDDEYDDEYSDDEETVTDYDIRTIREKLAHFETNGLEFPQTITPTTTPGTTTVMAKRESKYNNIRVILQAYAPCMLIAVFTHLLIQHMRLFESYNHLAESITDAAKMEAASTTSSSSLIGTIIFWYYDMTNPRDSWQFWGWINMFSTLVLYSIELMVGGKGKSEDLIEQQLSRSSSALF